MKHIKTIIQMSLLGFGFIVGFLLSTALFCVVYAYSKNGSLLLAMLWLFLACLSFATTLYGAAKTLDKIYGFN